MSTKTDCLLGKETRYDLDYDSKILHAIPRKENREELNITTPLPFQGVDIWNAYEVSWLDFKGKPKIAICQFGIPCESSHIIESKSLKIYLNSLNQMKCPIDDHIKNIIQRDLSNTLGIPINIHLFQPNHFSEFTFEEFEGKCIDDLDIEIDQYTIEPNFLRSIPNTYVEETLYSNLLKSNCLITLQPDWGSILIRYKGPKIDQEGLLRYIASLRCHQEFHENCIERIYMDIMRQCKTEMLTVYGKYTRRGGVDICPFRSNFEPNPIDFARSARQ
ncbi:MAG: NADPH-dependent 7-cyano-7-deazaguanine reductase QueF [Chlamydiales bacterium]